MPLLMVNAVTCLPAGEIVFSPIVSSCCTTAASNDHTPVTMKAVKINCLISIVSIHAHTGATKAGKFPLKTRPFKSQASSELRWRTQSETIDGIEMPQWRPVKIRAAISNAFGVACGDHGGRAQRHGCHQCGRLKTIFLGRQQSLVHSRFAIAGARRRRRFRRRFFISLCCSNRWIPEPPRAFATRTRTKGWPRPTSCTRLIRFGTKPSFQINYRVWLPMSKPRPPSRLA